MFRATHPLTNRGQETTSVNFTKWPGRPLCEVKTSLPGHFVKIDACGLLTNTFCSGICRFPALLTLACLLVQSASFLLILEDGDKLGELLQM